MTTYFSADLHIGHLNMTREGKDLCGRPFDTVVEMNEGIIHGFNEVLTRNDRLVLLGDICMGKLEDSLMWLSYLNAGEIILVPGNHDRWSLAYQHRGSEEEQAEKREMFRLRYEIDERFKVIPDQLMSAWVGANDWLVGAEHPLSRVWFSHYPFDGDSHGEDRYSQFRPFDDGLPVVHGHVHTEWQVRGNQFNVGVDVNDFRPVSEEELASWVQSL